MLGPGVAQLRICYKRSGRGSPKSSKYEGKIATKLVHRNAMRHASSHREVIIRE